jgi:hypothetical protein
MSDPAITARLDRLEEMLTTLTQWAERTAGQLMYSPGGRPSVQEPLDGPFDVVDEARRVRAILGRGLSSGEFHAVQQRATVGCRSADDVLAAFRHADARFDAQTAAQAG